MVATFIDFDSDMSGHNRYIGDILPIYIADIRPFFLIFPSNDFCLQKSCQKGSTPEISTIYRDIFVHVKNPS